MGLFGLTGDGNDLFCAAAISVNSDALAAESKSETIYLVDVVSRCIRPQVNRFGY